MIRALLAIVRPFHNIAKELRILRELYEEELSNRNPPIYRITEQPDKKDTEVMYSGQVDKRPPWKRALGWDQEHEE